MAGWKSKAPEDMTLDELQKAKEALAAEFAEVQEHYGWLQAAITNVDFQVGQRFSLAGAPVMSPTGLPEWPADQINGKTPEVPETPTA
jgi:hypothetical protein